MTHAERMESVDNCKWTDEVAADAPWMIDQAWLDKWEIDYVAHDEEVYPTKAVDDVYDFVKRQGRFLSFVDMAYQSPRTDVK
jgi:choline-phosphate cytidylyltransferase